VTSRPFLIIEVFDIASREGLLVVGTFLDEQPIGVPAMRRTSSA
jgi:hypothetical protein